MTFVSVKAKLLRLKCQYVCVIGTKMSFEQRPNIKFCFKIGKTFTETFELMKKVYSDDCLSRARVHEWFTRFRDGREDINDDEQTGRPKSVITENSIEIVREFIKNEPKSSLKFMESELNISKTSIYRISTDHLGLRKVCACFVPHKLTDDQKLLRIQHSKDIIKEARKDENFLYNIVTGDKTWCFQYKPKTKRQSAEWKAPDEPPPKKSRLEKLKIKSMLICFHDSKGIVHKEFVQTGQTVNAIFCLGVLKRLLHRIHRIRPEYREGGSWRLLHDNAPSHRSTLVTDFLTRNRILTINHSPYSPDMAPCDFYLFGKLHLAMKEKHFASVEAIQKACTNILRDNPVNDLKHSFEKLLDRAKQCIEAGGDYCE